LHLPTISLPLFQDSISGLPFGVQIIGAQKFSDPVLFEFIKAAQMDDSALIKFRS
jgi:Asp-tRNA(Asn)/Glu-tRNA(Gln) amidotransferase A subunit family amidase